MKLPLSRRAFIGVIAATSAVAGGVVLLPAGATAAVSYVVLGHSNTASSPTNINNTAGTPLGLTAKTGQAPLWVNSSKVVARLNADYVNGYHASSFAKVSGKTGTITAIDEAAVCPAGTVLTGGGGIAFEVDPVMGAETDLPLVYSVPGFNLNTGLPIANSWLVLPDPAKIDANTHVEVFAICYNPNGAVPGASTTAATGARSAGKALAKANAANAPSLQKLLSSQASAQTSVATTAIPHFANCKALNAKYKHGVGVPGARDKVRSRSDKPVTNFYRSKAIYQANSKLDRDHDSIACEKR